VAIGCALASTFALAMLNAAGWLQATAFFGFTVIGLVLFIRLPGALARVAAFSRVELRVDPMRPGEETRLQLMLEPRGTVTIRSARLVMRAIECALIREGDHHAEQRAVAFETSWPLELPKQLGEPFTHPMRLIVPARLCPGAPRALSTELEVQLELEHWPLATTQVPVTVLPPAARREAEPAPSRLDNDTELWVVIDRAQFRLGETVRGEIKISPERKAQQASALAVRLIWLAHGTGEDRRHPVAELQLAKGPFTEGASLPFELTLPPQAPLTYRGEIIDIDWYVEAELLDTPGMAPLAHAGFVVG